MRTKKRRISTQSYSHSYNLNKKSNNIVEILKKYAPVIILLLIIYFIYAGITFANKKKINDKIKISEFKKEIGGDHLQKDIDVDPAMKLPCNTKEVVKGNSGLQDGNGASNLPCDKPNGQIPKLK